MNCLNCSVTTKNPKFCSKSCAASYNNKIHPKRISKKWFCTTCGVEVQNRRTKCDEHNPSYVDWNAIGYANLANRYNYQRNTRIRSLARRIYAKSDRPKKCLICGYDKHYEVCHVRPINDFGETDTISTINNIDNLVALCPNHHWELDNNLLVSLTGLEPASSYYAPVA